MSGATVTCPGCGEPLDVTFEPVADTTRRGRDGERMLLIGTAPHKCPASKGETP